MENKATDIVCGKEIKIDGVPASAAYGEKIFYFCSKECLQKFQDSPKSLVDDSLRSKFNK